jgi:hypothetical protein
MGYGEGKLGPLEGLRNKRSESYVGGYTTLRAFSSLADSSN